RISISGLSTFIRETVAEMEHIDPRNCRIVDAHYFRGRFAASEMAEKPDALYKERVWEDILMRAGVVTHYLPVARSADGGYAEKGIDVWFALETLELAMYKRFNVSVLIAGDGDYLPLLRKLHTLGTRTMILWWDFAYTDDAGRSRTTRTSQVLLDEATYA